MNILLIIFGSVFSASVGQLLFKIGMNKVGVINNFGIHSLVRIFGNIYVLIGCGFYLIGLFLWLVALSKKNLNYVYPFTILTFILVLFFSQFILNESISRYVAAGYFLIIAGIIVISYAMDA